MSLIYSILKPVLRKASAGRAVMTREDFVRQAEKKQRRNLTFSEIAGFEKKEREIAGCRCIVYSKNGSDHSKAMVYYAGGGYIRYQLPNKKSIRTRYLGDQEKISTLFHL